MGFTNGAVTAVHEAFHLAGRYSDRELADAVTRIVDRAYRPFEGIFGPLERPQYTRERAGSWEEILAASRYWGQALRDACEIRRR